MWEIEDVGTWISAQQLIQVISTDAGAPLVDKVLRVTEIVKLNERYARIRVVEDTPGDGDKPQGTILYAHARWLLEY